MCMCINSYKWLMRYVEVTFNQDRHAKTPSSFHYLWACSSLTVTAWENTVFEQVHGRTSPSAPMTSLASWVSVVMSCTGPLHLLN